MYKRFETFVFVIFSVYKNYNMSIKIIKKSIIANALVIINISALVNISYDIFLNNFWHIIIFMYSEDGQNKCFKTFVHYITRKEIFDQ